MSASFYYYYFKASFGHKLQLQNVVTQVFGYKSQKVTYKSIPLWLDSQLRLRDAAINEKCILS